jgi:hypothetical protein
VGLTQTEVDVKNKTARVACVKRVSEEESGGVVLWRLFCLGDFGSLYDISRKKIDTITHYQSRISHESEL